MTEPWIDVIARILSRRSSRRLVSGGLIAAGGGLAWPVAALAACKKVGRKCDKTKDCCDGAECRGGECKCKSGRDECRGKCAKLDTDEQHCGGCDSPCAPGEACCGGACVDQARDPTNCGACGEVCDATEECIAGVCTVPPGGCPVGADTCAGTLVPCFGGAPCVCLQSTEGTTHCADQATPGAICCQCERSADCADFGPGAFCATTCCPGGDKACRLPCLT